MTDHIPLALATAIEQHIKTNDYLLFFIFKNYLLARVRAERNAIAALMRINDCWVLNGAFADVFECGVSSVIGV